MGIPFTMTMGFLFTATIGNLFTMTLGIQLTISTHLLSPVLPAAVTVENQGPGQPAMQKSSALTARL